MKAGNVCTGCHDPGPGGEPLCHMASSAVWQQAAPLQTDRAAKRRRGLLRPICAWRSAPLTSLALIVPESEVVDAGPDFDGTTISGISCLATIISVTRNTNHCSVFTCDSPLARIGSFRSADRSSREPKTGRTSILHKRSLLGFSLANSAR
jgi:hypothetical protein